MILSKIFWKMYEKERASIFLYFRIVCSDLCCIFCEYAVVLLIFLLPFLEIDFFFCISVVVDGWSNDFSVKVFFSNILSFFLFLFWCNCYNCCLKKKISWFIYKCIYLDIFDYIYIFFSPLLREASLLRSLRAREAQIPVQSISNTKRKIMLYFILF